jgi:hypothetical protein
VNGTLIARLIAAGAAVSAAASLLAESPAGEPASAGRPPATAPSRPGEVRQAAKRLRSASLAPPSEGASAESLREAIRMVRALQVVERRRAPEPTTAPATAPASGPAEEVEPARRPSDDPLAGPPELTDEALERLAKLSEEEVIDAESLAEALFRAGHHRHAFRFYQQAHSAAGEGRRAAWLLYQMGNSAAAFDEKAAMQIYRRVADRHGDTAWAQPAGVQANLIEWRREHEPEQDLAEYAGVDLGPSLPRPPVGPTASRPASATKAPKAPKSPAAAGRTVSDMETDAPPAKPRPTSAPARRSAKLPQSRPAAP